MCNLEYFGSTVSLQWMEMFRNRWLAPLISYPKWKKVTENLKWIGKILHSAWPNNTAYTCAIWSTLAEQGTCGERNARNLLRAGLRSTAQVSGFTFYGTESRFYGKLQKRPLTGFILFFSIESTSIFFGRKNGVCWLDTQAHRQAIIGMLFLSLWPTIQHGQCSCRSREVYEIKTWK